MINPNKNICSHFLITAKSYPDTIALIENGQEVTYHQLLNEVLQTVQYFQEKGLKPGDKVLVFVPMCINLYRIVLALLYVGAIAVFIDEWVNKERMEKCCSVVQCQAIIGNYKLKVLRFFSKELKNIPLVLNPKKIVSIKNIPPFHFALGYDPALITFTTGSTGTPKAAIRTHHQLNEQFNALNDIIKPSQGDVVLTTLPIVLLINLGVGATSVIENFSNTIINVVTAEKIYGYLNKYKVTRFITSPYFVVQLAKYTLTTKKTIPSLNSVYTGGAPVYLNEAEILKNAFPNANIHVVYGSTEAEPISSTTIENLILLSSNNEGICVGKTDSITELKIIPITENSISKCNELNSMPYGEIGEIVVAGNHVVNQYQNNSEAFLRNKIQVGNKIFHRTGDSGFLDRGNNLFLTGRCATIIKNKNKTIFPFVVENSLKNITGITLATALMINNKVYIIVEKEKEADENEIKLHITQIVNFESEVIFIKEIPRDPRHHSKIEYEKLRKHILNSTGITR